MIELSEATKRVGRVLHIKPTTATFKPGEFNVLLGATGSGKTSLIKLMAGLDPIASGTIRMDGKDVTRLSTQKRNVSLVHQFFVNYPHMSVFENIASPLRVAGMTESEVKGRVEDAAKLLQLTPMLTRRPQELSGGQQQRTALARAIAKESRAVFLDEPPATQAIDALRAVASTEEIVLKGGVLYLYTPDGFGRSKVAESLDRLLKVPWTARNWNTVLKLREIAAGAS